MKKKDAEKLREKLLTMKREILSKIEDKLGQSHQTAENKPSDPMDIASDSYDDDFNVSMAGRSAQELAEINEALEKVNDGTYGLCSSCGKQIKAARLKALPFATLCLECKAESERENPSVGSDSGVMRWE